MNDNNKYGETETEQDIQLMIKSREIVKEIVNYGVTESQKIQIIKLLSLELEDGNLMREITRTLENKNKKQDEKKLIY
jgi:hypothetical protein